MERTDARKRYTQMVLKQAFLTLLKEKPVNKITVKEVCALAQLNRATFYAHYSDCFALKESIENELMDEIAQVIEEHPLDLVQNGSSYPMIEHIFTILDNNKDICIALMGSNGDMGFVSRMEKMVADTVLRQLSGKFAANNHDVEYVYAFCLNGCVGMIKAWLSSEHRESTKHIAELTNRMIENTTHDFLRQIPNA